MRILEPDFIGKTYDDFLLRPQLSPLSTRRKVSLRTPLSRRLSLELPVVSANMDSVTGARMATAMALEGGIGVIHRGMSIAAQAERVATVKRMQGHVVEQPWCLPRGSTIGEAREFTRKHQISGILIEERPGSGILAGLLSHRDLPWDEGCEDRPVDDPSRRLHDRGFRRSSEQSAAHRTAV